MREVAIIFSQPKISQTAFPVLPSGDRAYRYPNQLIPDPLKPSPIGSRHPRALATCGGNLKLHRDDRG